VAFPHPEASLRIYQGSLPWHLEKSPVAVRGLRAGELVPPPQPVGPAKGVVSLEAAKRPPKTNKYQQQPAFPDRQLFQNQEII
jgi:hypothetical protein